MTYYYYFVCRASRRIPGLWLMSLRWELSCKVTQNISYSRVGAILFRFIFLWKITFVLAEIYEKYTNILRWNLILLNFYEHIFVSTLSSFITSIENNPFNLYFACFETLELNLFPFSFIQYIYVFDHTNFKFFSFRGRAFHTVV